ncbi:ubiquitin-like modifier-activating enzyme ATG7 [Folsomia candida]|uniref:Ubiquitin-like modifier-activating enzyme ATG7 n=1 Tax=Folsomia candida TaxID=158441 RepID=A0A226E2Q4_FOLCA|nr:ubiquitin-like modifier-activating enzyme ATG7 [Folsomia candida]OXA51314.1 Ubiquitin-like modifier-activating enzyme ATG7 [Folsomia candida]
MSSAEPSSNISMAISDSSTTTGGGGPKMMFAPFSSLISPTFWGKFDEVKVEVLQLNEDPVPICGFYAPHDMPGVNPIISVDNTSFDVTSKPHYGAIKAPGMIKTTISAEHFKAIDYNELMRNFGKSLFGEMLFSEEGLTRLAQNPTMLASFFILTYADLKKYKFLFWFGFPAISLPSVETFKVGGSTVPASEAFPNYEQDLAKRLQQQQQQESGEGGKGFFLLVKNSEGSIELKSLEQIDQIITSQTPLSNLWFGFLDTSSIDDTPSWVLRNYLAFIKLKLKLPAESEVNIFSYRPGRSATMKDVSCSYRVLFHGIEGAVDSLDTVKFVGWERNDKGAFGPKHVDAQMTMDPIKLAENSVDFNLKLMKWRLFPEFDLKMMHRTKCLIIGAGTLGCNVARCLMGWGVRHIAFADNGNVSYSNPVRQSLYNFDDCSSGGKGKAETAAASLKKIFPGIKSQAAKIMVPMPGHPISAGTVEQVKKDYDKLVELVQECDVMFLLMDTRESRWLPTVLGAKYGKIVINAALGFDSYLVMRHGMSVPGTNKRTLGCYYCTDVVAPGDSTKDRTLDQQCTVTRPGVSMIAAALAVELMASILHHPEKAMAPGNVMDSDSSLTLGFVPHSIRGFLGTGEQISPSFQAYDKCTGCSEKVLAELDQRGFDFVTDVLNSSSEYLEKLTGLDKMKEIADLAEGIIELSDDDDDF